jgi:hypothetical protein
MAEAKVPKVPKLAKVDSATLADMLGDYTTALRVMRWLEDEKGLEPKEGQDAAELALEFACSSRAERAALVAVLELAVDDEDC